MQDYAIVIIAALIFFPLFTTTVYVVTKVAIFIARFNCQKNYPKIK